MIDKGVATGSPVAREADRPVRRRGPVSWVDLRGRRLGGWAFVINRVTGLGVLAGGPSMWDQFVSIAGSPVFLLLDVVLLFGLLAHGLNGIRVALVGLGIVIDRQRALFVAFFVIGFIVFLIGAVRIFGDTGGAR
jgi:succinate dehydrogenase/fumarate reductase cytochrome b subunit